MQGCIKVLQMVLLLPGDLEIGAHIRRNLCYLIGLRHFIRARTVTTWILFFRKDVSSFMRAQYILSYHLKGYYGFILVFLSDIFVRISINTNSIRVK